MKHWAFLFFLLLFAACDSGRRDDDNSGDDDDSADDDDSGDDDDSAADAGPESWPALESEHRYASCTWTQTIDRDGDGSVDSRSYGEMNEDGYETQYTVDFNDDGEDDQLVEFTRGPGNHPLEEHSTSLNDLGNNYRITYEYNSDGLITEVSYDDGDNGEVNDFQMQIWEGDLLSEVRRDADGDGDFDWVRYFYYSGDDLVRIEYDTDGNGAINYIGNVELNAAGQIELIELETPTGAFAGSQTWTFTNPELWWMFSFDSTGDGEWNQRIMRDFGPEWRLIEWAEDEGDGWINIRKYDYECP